jgi:hypothetical protein
MKIYKTTDRLKIKIGDAIITISPLNLEQKIEIQTVLSKGTTDAIYRGSALALKYAVKDVEGITFANGEKYVVELENGVLKDSIVEDLLNFEQAQDLMITCNSLVEGIPKGVELINP